MWRCGLTSLRFCCAVNVVTASVARPHGPSAPHPEARRPSPSHLTCRHGSPFGPPIRAAVAVRHIDASVRADDDVVGLIEVCAVVTGLPGCAEAHEQLAVRAELVDLMALGA